jgi:mitochondrial import inner membrane translocase subunit TIM21
MHHAATLRFKSSSSTSTILWRRNAPRPILALSSLSSSEAASLYRGFNSNSNNNNFLQQQCIIPPIVSPLWQRSFSSQAKKEDEPSKSKDEEEDPTKDIVLTPGEQVVVATRLSMWLGILAFASMCAYYIGKELLPTKMSPNTVFNGSSKVIRENLQVQRQYGDKLKFYGKDHGGHREGRRNFIEHTEYTSEDDGSKRTRVRFNMEGQFATAFCFAEVSNQYDDYVYILVQDKQTGRVISVKDNRAAMTAQRLAGGNAETANAMKQLLGGGGSGSGGASS